MWPVGDRSKKLVVAFHFQFSSQAAWKCDACRKGGLNQARNCGWLPEGERSRGKPVWVRKGVSVETCPVSYVTPQSLAWIEAFVVWKRFGGRPVEELPARTVDAFLVLEDELRKEVSNGEQRT